MAGKHQEQGGWISSTFLGGNVQNSILKNEVFRTLQNAYTLTKVSGPLKKPFKLVFNLIFCSYALQICFVFNRVDNYPKP